MACDRKYHFEGEAMSDDASTTQTGSKRRVYDLPIELVDRITAFQKAKRLPSEVEAVRRLLDEALLTRDGVADIVNRLQERLKLDGMVTSVAKDVLVGHPLVSSLSFVGNECVEFRLRSGELMRIWDNGKAYEFEDGEGYNDGRWVEFLDLSF